MNKNDLYELIIKKLSSNISEEEQKQLFDKLSNDHENNEMFLSIQEYWNNFYPKTKPNNIIEKTEKKLDFTYHQPSAINSKLIFKLVASVLLILSVGYSSYHFFKPKQKLVLNEYSCAAGEIKEIVLSDGTKVWLNSKSFLIASEPFIGSIREVKLFGEAYFEVAHKEDQPFIVKTPQLRTKVLGTHFNVVAYPTDEVHEISLHEGGILLRPENNKDTKVILKPGERAYFTAETGKIRVINTDLGQAAKWRDGILRFYDEDLFSISKKLERKFHKKIFITDSVAGNLKFTAEFDVESLNTILELFKKAHDFEYSEMENGIIIKSSIKKMHL